MSLEKEMLCAILKNTEKLLSSEENERDNVIRSLQKRVTSLERRIAEMENIMLDYARQLGQHSAKIELSEKDIENLKKKKGIF